MVWIFALLGLLVGVILNLCADSLPMDRRLHLPKCAHCGTSRQARAWSAVVAYLIRGHRCPSCSAPISPRHVIVELSTALLYAYCWLHTEATVTTALNLFYVAVFVLVFVTDLEHRLILHVVMLPAILIALLGAFVNPAFASPKRALLGGLIGLVGTLAVYLFGALFARYMGRLRGSPISEVAFGFGDVTLNTFIGLVVGAPEIVFAMVIGFLVGGLAAVLYLIVQGLFRRQYQLFTAIPYGPFLIFGGMMMLCYGSEIVTWYISR